MEEEEEEEEEENGVTITLYVALTEA